MQNPCEMLMNEELTTLVEAGSLPGTELSIA